MGLVGALVTRIVTRIVQTEWERRTDGQMTDDIALLLQHECSRSRKVQATATACLRKWDTHEEQMIPWISHCRAVGATKDAI